jgi:Glycosyltransferase family 9 (heptosyltransferase)
LTSTSCNEIAQELLDRCLAGRPPAELPAALLDEPGGPALFGILVEGLADRFEPRLCDMYARLFSQAVARVAENVDPASLVARYERVRRPRPISGEPHRVFVLSRVTLGADVAVTSVLLAAARQRFPHAEIVFVGPRANYDLFAGDPRLRHAEMPYRRGGLRDRLAVWDPLQALLATPDSVVIDPDSRLTQLGLLPVCPEDAYHLFESRGYGRETDRALPELAAAWAEESFGVSGAKPYIALRSSAGPRVHPLVAGDFATHTAISLGVGENPAKRIPDPFEERLLGLLSAGGATLAIDKGAGGEEAARVERAVGRSGVKAAFWEGSFAGFAAIIAASRLYVGYDSAGQHVAAACGVPLISVFAGFPAPRMFHRWRPTGERTTVIRVDRPDPLETLERVRAAMAS